MPHARLEQTMAYIESHPEQHDQSVWVEGIDLDVRTRDLDTCGTAACLAGWSVLLFRPDLVRDKLLNVGAVQYDIEAIKLFGITSEQADVLFTAEWKIPNLRQGVDALYEHPGISANDLADVMGDEFVQMDEWNWRRNQ